MPSNFWMIVNNERNFRITQDMGFSLVGLKSQHRRKVQRISDGDRILMYVTHIRRFVATATATSDYFESDEVTWEKEGRAGFPYRVEVRPEIVLRDEQFMDANQIAPRLEYVKRWAPEDWYMAFQGNLHLLPKSDFLLIEEEMKKLHFGKDYQPTPVTPSRAQQRRRRPGPRPANQAPRPPAAAPGQRSGAR
jgi:hypothetical protein